ncbi:MAG: phosphatase PAP2 family protein [Gaiellaceae bacterium]
MSRRNRVQGKGALAVALTAAYAALAALAATGALNGLDQWSIDHLMPGLTDGGRRPSLVDAAVPLRRASWATGLDVVANVVTLPAQALVASTLAGVCCLVLWRRAQRRAALVWGLAWVAANAVEVLCKTTLARPLLHANGHSLVAFESSYPSGHALRSVLLAAAVATIWPFARRWVAAWAAASLVLLELDGFHVPSDIAGGLLLGLLLILAARRAGQRLDVD